MEQHDEVVVEALGESCVGGGGEAWRLVEAGRLRGAGSAEELQVPGDLRPVWLGEAGGVLSGQATAAGVGQEAGQGEEGAGGAGVANE